MSVEYTTYEKLILSLASMDACNRGLALSVLMAVEVFGLLISLVVPTSTDVMVAPV